MLSLDPNFLLSPRQFRTTFRALFLTPIRNSLCLNASGGDGVGEMENTDVITGNKSRYFAHQTAITLTFMLTDLTRPPAKLKCPK